MEKERITNSRENVKLGRKGKELIDYSVAQCPKVNTWYWSTQKYSGMQEGYNGDGGEVVQDSPSLIFQSRKEANG